MQIWIIAFGLGLLLILGIQSSPSLVLLWGLLVGAILLVKTAPWLRWVSGMSAGLFWGLINVAAWQEGRLPESLQGQAVVLSGTVVTVQGGDPRRTKITFLVDCLAPYTEFSASLPPSFIDQNCRQPFKLAQLSWYAPVPEIAPGQHWQFAAKLKWGHGFANPGGFDYERWLMQQRIQAVGYVRKEVQARRIERLHTPEPTSGDLLDSWWLRGANWQARFTLMQANLNGVRFRVQSNLVDFLADSEFRGIITALVMGDRKGISAAQQQVLRDTGTAHLMSISGLHIGLLAGLAYWLTKVSIGLFPKLMTIWPLHKWALTGACLAATGYAALAGFSTPTLRAVFMLYVYGFYSFRDLPQEGFRSLLIAGLLVLIVAPFDIFSVGFWLSFVAVGVIIWCVQGRLKQVEIGTVWQEDEQALGRFSRRRIYFKLARSIREWGVLQWGIFVGLLPCSLYFIGQISLLAPFINLLVIPVFGWIIVPLSLLGSALMTVSPVLAQAIFDLLDWLLAVMWPFFEWTAGQSAWIFQKPALELWLEPILLLVLTITSLLVLAAKGLPFKSVGLVLGGGVIVFVSASAGSWEGKRGSDGWFSGGGFGDEQIPVGGVDFALLDVGQGLSVVIRTQQHSLVYDLGPSYGPNLDAGRAVVVPFLNSVGVRHVDALILSHDDTDHTGGFESFEQYFNVDRVYAPSAVIKHFSEHKSMKQGVSVNCLKPLAWQWDDVNFMVYAVARPKFTQQDASATDNKISLGQVKPRKRPKWADNNQSCVLKIWGDGFSVLIPGDLEKKAERALVQAFPLWFDSLAEEVSLRADILVLPHHGSRTSSSASFLQAVQPKHGLASAGYLNRFKHPYSGVVSRLEAQAVRLFRTDQSGALQYRLRLGQALIEPEHYRIESRKLWHHP